MRKFAAVIPLALLAWAFAFDHPRVEPGSYFGPDEEVTANVTANIPAAVFATSLNDSMPAGWMNAVGLDYVPGFKVSTVSGHSASYFEYKADRHKLIDAFTLLPFHRSVTAADTTARAIPLDEVLALRQYLGEAELENAAGFFAAAVEGAEAYQCLKPPFLHTIIIHPVTKKVFHRMETV